MTLDRDRIRAIADAEHSYYGTRRATVRHDGRLSRHRRLRDGQVSPTMRVLDIGCGNGETLLEHSDCFHDGVGIDIDPAHIEMAREAKRTQGIENVEFLLLDFPREIERLQPESFDMVYSQRGMDITPASFEAAVRLLRPDGLFFVEEIGELAPS